MSRKLNFLKYFLPSCVFCWVYPVFIVLHPSFLCLAPLSQNWWAFFMDCWSFKTDNAGFPHLGEARHRGPSWNPTAWGPSSRNKLALSAVGCAVQIFGDSTSDEKGRSLVTEGEPQARAPGAMREVGSGGQRQAEMQCLGRRAAPWDQSKAAPKLDQFSPHSCGHLNSLQRVYSFWLPRRLSWVDLDSVDDILWGEGRQWSRGGPALLMTLLVTWPLYLSLLACGNFPEISQALN